MLFPDQRSKGWPSITILPRPSPLRKRSWWTAPGPYRPERCYESLKKLSDSKVIALAFFQRLPGVESERSSLRDAARYFAHLFPGGR